MSARRNEIRVADPKQVIRIPFEFEGDEVTFDRTFTGTGMIRRVVGRRVAKGELVIDVDDVYLEGMTEFHALHEEAMR